MIVVRENVKDKKGNLILQCGKQEGMGFRRLWKKEEEEEEVWGFRLPRWQKVCVLCVKISVQVRGEVCMLRRVEFHTSHLTHIPTCHRV